MNVYTYNVGALFNTAQVWGENPADDGDWNILQAERNAKLTSIFMESNADIVCLQEVNDTPTMIESWLSPGNYTFERGEEQDTLVAWNPDKFEHIRTLQTDDGGDGGLYTIVDLKEKSTGRTIRVASAHLTGCDPVNPDAGEIQEGNRQLQHILGKIDEDNHASVTLLGMDANVTPQVEARLGIAKKAGFVQDPGQMATEGGFSGARDAKKIDYLFYRTARGFEVSKEEWANDAPMAIGVGENKKNPSDHRPLGRTITVAKKTGLIARLGKKIWG